MSIDFETLSRRQGKPVSSQIRFGPWMKLGTNEQRVIMEDFFVEGKLKYSRPKGIDYRIPPPEPKGWTWRGDHWEPRQGWQKWEPRAWSRDNDRDVHRR